MRPWREVTGDRAAGRAAVCLSLSLASQDKPSTGRGAAGVPLGAPGAAARQTERSSGRGPASVTQLSWETSHS